MNAQLPKFIRISENYVALEREMTEDEQSAIEQAFRDIHAAISDIEGPHAVDGALDEIAGAIQIIAPGILDEVQTLSIADIASVLEQFSLRALDATEARAGNSVEQTFMALVLASEVRRRAQLDGITTLEWCRREQIRGFLDD